MTLIADQKTSRNGKKTKLLRIDLACGQVKKEGFTGVDIVKLPGVDIVCNLTKFPWSFESNSVDEIYCSHFIEHLDGETFIKFMDECYRIMKVGTYVENVPQQEGAHITFIAPYYSSVRAIQDPTHKQFISEQSFLYYNKKWREDNKLTHYPIKSDFDFSYSYFLDPEITTWNHERQRFAIKFYNNSVSDIMIRLIKKEKTDKK